MKIFLLFIFIINSINGMEATKIGPNDIHRNLTAKCTELGLKISMEDGHIKLSKDTVSAITYSFEMDGRISTRPTTDEIADRNGVIIELWIEPSKTVQEQWAGRFKAISLAGLADGIAIIKRPYDSMYGCQGLINNGNDLLLINVIYNNADSLLMADHILDIIKALVM